MHIDYPKMEESVSFSYKNKVLRKVLDECLDMSKRRHSINRRFATVRDAVRLMSFLPHSANKS